LSLSREDETDRVPLIGALPDLIKMCMQTGIVEYMSGTGSGAGFLSLLRTGGSGRNIPLFGGKLNPATD
jgi:hypothetical protein